MRFFRRKWGLFWRVYVHGVLILVVVAVTVGILTRLLGSSSQAWRDSEHGVSAYLGEQLGPKLDDPAELEAELERLRRSFQADYAVYRRDHTLVAAAGDRVLAPAGEVPDRLRFVHGTWQAPILHTDAYLVASRQKRNAHAHGLGIIGGVLVVLAAMSIPFARRIARPVERLTETARQLGAGNLGARSGVKGHGEVGELARAMDEMAARIERLLQSEKELLANVSHELRTPLARIRVALTLAGEAEPEDQQALRERLDGIDADLAELETLIDDTLTTARLDLARGTDMPLNRSSLSWSSLVEQVAVRFVELHIEHRLEVHVAENLPEMEVDNALLRRVLDNLLDNAVRYAEPSAGPVELVITRDGPGAKAEVRDRGIGVVPEDLPRLFEPFFRSDASRARATGGVGLGLALCRRVVEAHGGTIGARARDGGGSVFWLTLPPSG